jgi:hypothetical protein
MKKYTNEERFDALNRHHKTMSINDNGIFTTFTQRCRFTSFEDYADLIITKEKFYKEYGYERYSFFPDRHTFLYKKQYDWYVYYIISSIKLFSYYFTIIEKRENTQNLISTLLEQQILHLNEAIDKLKYIDIIIKDLEPNLTHSYIQDIQRFNSVEISKLVSKLYSKISD